MMDNAAEIDKFGNNMVKYTGGSDAAVGSPMLSQ